MHDDESRFGFGNQRHHFAVSSPPGNVVHNRSSRFNPRACNLGLRRVNRNDDFTPPAQLFDHRNHTAQFFLCGDSFGARSRGFAADIDDVRAFRCHLQTVLHGISHVEEISAVGK